MGSPFDALPDELLVQILGAVPCVQRVLHVPRVCRRWHAMASDWKATAVDVRPCLLLVTSEDVGRAKARLVAATRGHAACVEHICAGSRPTECAPYVAAIKRDDVASLRALGVHEQVLSTRDMAALAARYASAACLDYAMAQHGRLYIDVLDVPWRCDLAAPADHFACLARVLDAGCFIGCAGAVEAAWCGHVDCLAALWPMTTSDTQEIAEACGRHLDCLRLVCEHEAGALTCDADALHGRLVRLRVMHECGVAWRASTCAAAARGGHLDCLRYAHENGCPWDEITCTEAARHGHLACLAYAHDNGCAWDTRAIRAAIDGDHVECLRYMLARRQVSDGALCEMAAYNGHLECLRALHRAGCPWDRRALRSALIRDRVDCLRYMHTRGMAWRRRDYWRACWHNLECSTYMLINGERALEGDELVEPETGHWSSDDEDGDGLDGDGSNGYRHDDDGNGGDGDERDEKPGQPDGGEGGQDDVNRDRAVGDRDDEDEDGTDKEQDARLASPRPRKRARTDGEMDKQAAS